MRSLIRHRFYGQNGEDAILWRFFGGKRKGFYVDVGAFDGVYLSNSKVFEEAGWDGICVEALPEYARLCERNRRRCVNAAIIADDRETVELIADPSGLFTGQEPDTSTVAGYFDFFEFEPPTWEKVRVPAMTLNALLTDAPPIDFLSVDVEGGEVDALRGLDFERHWPRVIVAEANTDEERENLTEFVTGLGYHHARSVYWNHFFTASKEDAVRLRSVHTVAWLQRPDHPVRKELTAVGYPGRQLRVI